MANYLSIYTGTQIDNGITQVNDIKNGADGTTYASAGEAVRSQIGDINSDITTKENAIKSGLEADAIWHLGFYLDEDGDLCQVEE